MINYSITARAVNPNLFEINQAKTRINQAKAESKQPDAKDVALVETVVTNYFATAQYTEVMTIEKFARHIADHGTTYPRADIMAILYMAVDCMREQLLEGKKIRLGELGDFSLSLSSKGRGDGGEVQFAEHPASHGLLGTGQRVPQPPPRRRVQPRSDPFGPGSRPQGHQGGQDQRGYLRAHQPGWKPLQPGSPSNPGGTTQPKKRTLTVRSANESQGSVSGGGTFDEGSTQTVRATPKTGFAFDKWSDGSTQNPRTVKLTSDLTLTASFKTATTGGGDQGSGGDQGGGTLGD